MELVQNPGFVKNPNFAARHNFLSNFTHTEENATILAPGRGPSGLVEKVGSCCRRQGDPWSDLQQKVDALESSLLPRMREGQSGEIIGLLEAGRVFF